MMSSARGPAQEPGRPQGKEDPTKNHGCLALYSLRSTGLAQIFCTGIFKPVYLQWVLQSCVKVYVQTVRKVARNFDWNVARKVENVARDSARNFARNSARRFARRSARRSARRLSEKFRAPAFIIFRTKKGFKVLGRKRLKVLGEVWGEVWGAVSGEVSGALSDELSGELLGAFWDGGCDAT